VSIAARTVRLELGNRSYDVYIGPGTLCDVGVRIKELDRAAPIGKVFLIGNPTVDALYGDQVRASITDVIGDAPIDIHIPDGEQYKSLDTLSSIYDRILAEGADRGAVLVALGGGVIGDVVGFAAATVLRGVRFVQIPTTLLAQVDSSVGGKTAVNHREGKNLIGAFHQPAVVVSDPDTFATLPDREYRAGLAEVVKYGVILDAKLFDLIEQRADDVIAREPSLLTDVVARSVELKAYVVERDETEGGLRAILNFGHTVGHAIEKVTSYSRFLHGEAVALGMVAAARLSVELGACSSDVPTRLEALLSKLGLATEIPSDIDRADIVTAVGFDKKVRGDRVTFIVCDAMGECSRKSLEAAAIRPGL
jgi:3-dehydroquinate synthase